ncbi:MAG: amidohydrolase, partial [Gemmatimonadota bacterium]
MSPWIQNGRLGVVTASLVLVATTGLGAQEMSFEEYEPRSTLVVPENPVSRARFPFVDVHNHLRGELTRARVDSIVAAMDELNLAVMVNLSGGRGDTLRQRVQALKGPYPNRFVVFANPSYEGIDAPGYAERTA